MSPHLKLKTVKKKKVDGRAWVSPSAVDSNQCTETRTPSLVNGSTVHRKIKSSGCFATMPLDLFVCFVLLGVVVGGGAIKRK